MQSTINSSLVGYHRSATSGVVGYLRGPELSQRLRATSLPQDVYCAQGLWANAGLPPEGL